MKNTTKTLMAAMSLTLLLAVSSCSKYEGPNLIERTPVSLENTTWKYQKIDSVTVVDSITEENIKIDKLSYNYVIFGPDNLGKTKTGFYSVTGPGYIKAVDTVIDMKYTYSIPQGVMVVRVRDMNTMQWKNEEYPFTVNDTLLVLDNLTYIRQY